MADTGDGFNATYSMFNLIARDKLRIEHRTGHVDTQRGKVLVLGGDEVESRRKSKANCLSARHHMHGISGISSHTDLPAKRTQHSQVYPLSSYTEYTNRLIYPMRAAMPKKRDMITDVFAMPGNHDWYLL